MNEATSGCHKCTSGIVCQRVYRSTDVFTGQVIKTSSAGFVLLDDLKVIITYRFGEIRENTKVKEWRYVPAKVNPADMGTK